MATLKSLYAENKINKAKNFLKRRFAVGDELLITPSKFTQLGVRRHNERNGNYVVVQQKTSY